MAQIQHLIENNIIRKENNYILFDRHPFAVFNKLFISCSNVQTCMIGPHERSKKKIKKCEQCWYYHQKKWRTPYIISHGTAH